MAFGIKEATANEARNNVLDRVAQGAAASALVILAVQDLVSRYIHAPHMDSYFLAGGVVAMLVYAIVAPLFRR